MKKIFTLGCWGEIFAHDLTTQVGNKTEFYF